MVIPPPHPCPPAMRALSLPCVMRALSSPPHSDTPKPLVLLGNKPDTRDRNRRHPEGRTVESDRSDERLADIQRTARQSASDGHHDRTLAAGNPGMPLAIFTMRSEFGGSQVARESDDRVPDIAIRPSRQRTPLSAAVNGTRWPGPLRGVVAIGYRGGNH
jgi:hypothetical protein